MNIETAYPTKVFERGTRTTSEGLELPFKVSVFKVEEHEGRALYTLAHMGSHFQALVDASGEVEFLPLEGFLKENEELVKELTSKLVKRDFSSRIG